MGEHEFLKLLVRVIKLRKQIRIYNTAFNAFSYDLDEKNGKLLLTIHYPNMGDSVVVTYDTKTIDAVNAKLKDAEAYLESKLALSKRYI